MKVFIWGNKIFSIDMMWGFQQAGCQVRIIQAETVEQIQKELEDGAPDLLITMGAPIEFRRGALLYVGKRGPSAMKYIHWDTDGISSTYYKSALGDGIEMDMIYLSKPDLVLTMCPEMREFVLNRHFLCEMMYYAYSPATHRPLAGYENDSYFINLIGNGYLEFYQQYPNHYRYTSVKALVKPLLENGYQVHFYGDTGYRLLIKSLIGIDVPETFFHPFMAYEKTCACYNSSFINLVTQNHEHTITKRTFEILGSGGFALSYDNAALRELFVPGRDLAVSSSPEQTLELVKYYRENQDEWKKVRESGLNSVQQHTYKQRAEYILELMKKYWP